MTSTTSDSEPKDQAVLAYRVGQVEIALKEGLLTLNTKLDKLTYSFATKDEVKNLEKQSTVEHQAINSKIDETRIDLEKDIKDVQTDVDALSKKRWVQNSLSAIFGAVLAILVGYFLENIGR